MRDDQHRAVPFAQIPFQPFDRLDIQVVGRLVQQEQLGIGQQQAGQKGARVLPAGDLVEAAVIIGEGQTQPGQGLAHARLVGVPAAVFEARLHAAVGLEHFLAALAAPPADISCSRRCSSACSATRSLKAETHSCQTVRWSGSRGAAADSPSSRPARQARIARRGILQPGQNTQQGRFAHPVGADQADARLVRDGKRQPAENFIRTVPLGKPRRDQERHRG